MICKDLKNETNCEPTPESVNFPCFWNPFDNKCYDIVCCEGSCPYPYKCDSDGLCQLTCGDIKNATACEASGDGTPWDGECFWNIFQNKCKSLIEYYDDYDPEDYIFE